jgi:hypothetical protein
MNYLIILLLLTILFFYIILKSDDNTGNYRIYEHQTDIINNNCDSMCPEECLKRCNDPNDNQNFIPPCDQTCMHWCRRCKCYGNCNP